MVSIFLGGSLFSNVMDIIQYFIIKLFITKINLESVNRRRIFKHRVTLKWDKGDTLVFYVYVLLQMNDAVNGTAILILYEDDKGTKGWYM